ncbi:hypothetical protein DSO57_1035222 [Entomophthora muscae]|uniref:Uncharacterized protein n=1 Tax=Entomophthora muscae TaxID=34485 RepID=A0ACC2TLK2_9FUNG|nr:hypothetical protein DSO57_1035222 [Entomophthora muscae]
MDDLIQQLDQLCDHLDSWPALLETFVPSPISAAQPAASTSQADWPAKLQELRSYVNNLTNPVMNFTPLLIINRIQKQVSNTGLFHLRPVSAEG